MDLINNIPLEVVDKLPSIIKGPASSTLQTTRYLRWLANGKKGVTPHIAKIKTLIDYKKSYKCSVFIETGTFLGDTTYALQNRFQKIFSVEIDETLYKRAKKRFKTNKHIQILKGDSGKVLPVILKRVRKFNCLFWLDAHYSGSITARSNIDTPIIKELNSIIDSKIKNPVILIDDAKDFNGTHDYPKLSWLKKYLREKLPDHSFEVKDNIIRVTPTLI